MSSPKIRKCTVNINRLPLGNANVAQIQEQICMRRCYVRIKRLKNEPEAKEAETNAAGYKLRRCFIRLPRLPLVDMFSETSSVSSIVSGHQLHNDTSSDDESSDI